MACDCGSEKCGLPTHSSWCSTNKKDECPENWFALVGGPHHNGDLCYEGDGTCWVCTESGSPGKWARVKNPPPSQLFTDWHYPGVLHVSTADIDSDTIARFKQQFYESIGASMPAWRYPIISEGI